MTPWSLFLDDERFPVVGPPCDWVIARNVDHAIHWIKRQGCLPYRMSLDHDLGENEPTGFNFIQWLVEQDLDGNFDINTIEQFYVHSQNPVGATNMNKLFDNYVAFKNGVNKRLK